MLSQANVSNKREKRPPFQFKSGAVYEGEWRGNMRDGTGRRAKGGGDAGERNGRAGPKLLVAGVSRKIIGYAIVVD